MSSDIDLIQSIYFDACDVLDEFRWAISMQEQVECDQCNETHSLYARFVERMEDIKTQAVGLENSLMYEGG